MAAHRLRILHLSSLSAGVLPREGALFPQFSFEADLRKSFPSILASGGIDLVTIAGDITRAGRVADFGVATTIVDEILALASLPRSHLFVVPGAQDVQRGVAKAAVRRIRSVEDPARVSHWMAGGPAPPGLDSRVRTDALKRQAPFRRWVRSDLRRPSLIPSRASPHPRLGFRETIALRDLPFSVHVIGLDSAWLADGNAFACLTRDQVLCNATAQGKPLAGFRLSLVYHSLSTIVDQCSCRDDLTQHVDLVLCGTAPKSEGIGEDSARPIEIAAAGRVRSTPAFRVVDVDLDDAGHPLEIRATEGHDLQGRGTVVFQAQGPILEDEHSEPDEIDRWLSGSVAKPLEAIHETMRPESVVREALGEAPSPILRLVTGGKLGKTIMQLAFALGVPWTGPESWVRVLSRLLRSRQVVRVSSDGSLQSTATLKALSRRLPGVSLLVNGDSVEPVDARGAPLHG